MLRERAEWLADTGRPMWNPAYLERGAFLAKYSNPRCFLAMDGGEVVGGFALMENDEGFWKGRDHAGAYYVHKLVVPRRYEGKGYAGTMLGAIAELARAEGRSLLRLDYYEDRSYLERLYRFAGFSVVDRLTMPDGTVIRICERAV